MEDIIGNEIKIGDNVAYILRTKNSAYLETAEVVGFTKVMVNL